MGSHSCHHHCHILTLLPIRVCLPSPSRFMRMAAYHPTAASPLVDVVVLASIRIAVLAGRQEELRQVMRQPHTLELHPSSTIVDTPRAQLRHQFILLRLARHTTATGTKGILEDSKTLTSYNNRRARTSRREVATQCTVHLPVRHQERRVEMESLGDGNHDGGVAGRAKVIDRSAALDSTGVEDIDMRSQGQRAFSTPKLFRY